jgi:hypothetical protein
MRKGIEGDLQRKILIRVPVHDPFLRRDAPVDFLNQRWIPKMAVSP